MSGILRAVTDHRVMQGRGSVLGPDTNRRTHWYKLTLSCGHVVERRARYLPELQPNESPRQRYRSSVMAPRKRARCESCAL